jgi:hypothetical protein
MGLKKGLEPPQVSPLLPNINSFLFSVNPNPQCCKTIELSTRDQQQCQPIDNCAPHWTIGRTSYHSEKGGDGLAVLHNESKEMT